MKWNEPPSIGEAWVRFIGHYNEASADLMDAIVKKNKCKNVPVAILHHITNVIMPRLRKANSEAEIDAVLLAEFDQMPTGLKVYLMTKGAEGLAEYLANREDKDDGGKQDSGGNA